MPIPIVCLANKKHHKLLKCFIKKSYPYKIFIQVLLEVTISYTAALKRQFHPPFLVTFAKK